MSFNFSALMNTNLLTQLMGSSTSSTSLFGSSNLLGGFGSIFAGYSTGGTNGASATNQFGYYTNYEQAASQASKQHTAVMMSVLSMVLPSAATMLQDFISALVEAKAGDLPQGTPSASTRGAIAARNSAARAEAESQVQKSTVNETIAKNLSGDTINTDQAAQTTKSLKVNASALKNIKPNSQNLSGITSSFSMVGAEILNQAIYFDDITVPEFSSTISEDDINNNNITIEKINSEIAEIETHKGTITESFTKFAEITITDLKKCTTMISISVPKGDGSNETEVMKFGFEDEGYPTDLPDSCKADYDAKVAGLRKERQDQLKNLNDDLNEVKAKAKADKEKLNEQIKMLDDYKANLQNLDLDDKSQTQANSDDYLTALKGGKITTVKDIQNLTENEQEQVYTILSKASNVPVETLKGMSDDKIQTLLNENNGYIKNNIKNMENKAAAERNTNTSKLKLLDFANEGYKNLGDGSDVSRKQARQLRQKAEELLNQNPPGTYEDLQNYAAGLGISLKADNGTDSNNNGVKDDWTNTVTDGVELSSFASQIGSDATEVTGYLGSKGQTITNGKITSKQASMVNDYLAQTSTKEAFKPQMGVLSNPDDAMNILNNIDKDAFKNHLNKEEQTIAKQKANRFNTDSSDISTFLAMERAISSPNISFNSNGQIEVSFKLNDMDKTVTGADSLDVISAIQNEIDNSAAI